MTLGFKAEVGKSAAIQASSSRWIRVAKPGKREVPPAMTRLPSKSLRMSRSHRKIEAFNNSINPRFPSNPHKAGWNKPSQQRNRSSFNETVCPDDKTHDLAKACVC